MTTIAVPLITGTVLSLWAAISPTDLILIAGFFLADGYLVRFRRMSGLILWTNPERAGLSEERLTRIVGTYMLLIGGLTVGFAGLLVAGVPSTLVKLLFYLTVLVLVVVQHIHVRTSGSPV